MSHLRICYPPPTSTRSAARAAGWIALLAVTLIVGLIVIPAIAHAQAAAPVATFKGFDITFLVQALFGLVATGLTALAAWVARKKTAADAAAADTSKAELAGIRLAAIGVAMLGRAWDTLSPTIQAAIADGSISADERAAIEAKVRALMAEFTSEDELTQIGEALGLPLAGVIAKIASFLIDRFTAAHDPAVTTASALAYPVAESSNVGTGEAGGGSTGGMG